MLAFFLRNRGAMFNISFCCNSSKPLRADHTETIGAQTTTSRKEQLLAIGALVLGVLAVLGGALLLLFSGSMVSLFAPILSLLAMTLGSACIGGSLVYMYGFSLKPTRLPSESSELAPEAVTPGLVLSYQELLYEAEEDLKEVEGLLAQKSKDLELAQKKIEQLQSGLKCVLEESLI